MGNEEWRELLETEGPWLLIVRHGKTGGDRYAGFSEVEKEERRGERILSAVGWAEAELAGQFLAAGEVEPTNVYASPRYRARDTARLLFGRYETLDELRSADAGLRGVAKLQEQMAAIAEEKRRDVWVTHSPNILDLLGFGAREGQMFLLVWEDSGWNVGGTWRIDLVSTPQNPEQFSP